MELNNKVLVKVAVLLFLLGFTATTVDARFDPSFFVTQLFNRDADTDSSYFMKPSTTACCDNCVCTRSIPPQCQCLDVGEKCHSGCKSCICLLIYPPVCRCFDITDFCYPPCQPSQSQNELAH